MHSQSQEKSKYQRVFWESQAKTCRISAKSVIGQSNESLVFQ